MTDVKAVLAQREATYGNYLRQASIACQLKAVLWNATSFDENLAPDQREALEMIAVKLARIVNGDPNYADNWLDIAGYATLVATRLTSEAKT